MVELAQRLCPDVVIMDIGLPDINGLEAARQLAATLPEARVIVLTVYDNREYVLRAARVGARGYEDESPGLSTRERQVVALVAAGFSNREIADRLTLSVRTIETHRQHVMDKLDIHSVAGLTKYAIAEGLTHLG